MSVGITRDEYEAEQAEYAAALAERDKRIAELEKICNEYIEACNAYSTDLTEQRATIERLTAELVTMRPFFTKHALGPMMPPSCLVCGKRAIRVAIQHLELPGIVVCETCRNEISRLQSEIARYRSALEQIRVLYWQRDCGFVGAYVAVADEALGADTKGGEG